MSEVLVGILGFLCIVAIVVTLFKSKTMPSMAFTDFPVHPCTDPDRWWILQHR